MSVASGDARGEAKAPLRGETNNLDGAGAHFAFQCETPALQLCQMPRQWEPQSAAFMGTGETAVDLGETFKRLRQVVFRDTDPRVTNLQLNRTRFLLAFQDNAAAPRRKFDRVGQQIQKDLFHAPAVAPQKRKVVGATQGQRNTGFLCMAFHLS